MIGLEGTMAAQTQLVTMQRQNQNLFVIIDKWTVWKS